MTHMETTAKQSEQTHNPRGILARLQQRRHTRWSLRLFYALLFLAVFGEFIANDKPWVCQLEGRIYFPVGRELLVKSGLSQWPSHLINANFRTLTYDWSVWPPIRYAAHTLDLQNSNFVSPLAEQRVKHWTQRHWLGTDRVGRDTAAGLVAGARVALLVGLVAMALAAVVGLFFGALAGFFGDNRLRLSRARLVGGLVGAALGWFYGFIARGYALSEGVLWQQLGLSLLMVVGGTLLGASLLQLVVRRLSWWQHRVVIPADLLVMRLIEIIDAIPGLLLLLAVLAVVSQPSIWVVVAVIGFIGWLGIARFVRAELLRIRHLEYIDAARTIGLPEWRILWRHALPNALGPVFTTLAFGAAGAILTEAYLSFLGIGLPPDLVTWGGQIQSVRTNITAWWLAIFPGMAIFVTVAMLNILGEGVLEQES